jgi:hypothetical protein
MEPAVNRRPTPPGPKANRSRAMMGRSSQLVVVLVKNVANITRQTANSVACGSTWSREEDFRS